MAWIFSLAVECEDELAARACANYFARGAAAVPVGVAVEQGLDDGAWWAVVEPLGESRSGVTIEAVGRSLTAAGQALLDALRGAPPFRFALVGVEAFDAVEFGDRLAAGVRGLHGLVVAEDVQRRLDATLEPFAPGYAWVPYRGEKYALSDKDRD